MKKIVAVFLAVLMMVMPVLSMAEGFIQTWIERMAAGQEMISVVSMELGQGMKAQIGEGVEILEELLKAVAIESRFQSADGNMQMKMNLLLSGKPAVSMLAAKAGQDLIFGSSLLDDDKIAFSKDELKKALADSDAAEEVKNVLNTLLNLVFGGIEEEVDPQALMAALQEAMTEFNSTVEETMAKVEVIPVTAETFLSTDMVADNGFGIRITKEQCIDMEMAFINALLKAEKKHLNVEIDEKAVAQVKENLEKWIRDDLIIKVFYEGDDSFAILVESKFGPEDDKVMGIVFELSVTVGTVQANIGVAAKLSTDTDDMLFKGNFVSDFASYVIGTMTVDGIRNGEVTNIETVDLKSTFAETENGVTSFVDCTTQIPTANMEVKVIGNMVGTMDADVMQIDTEEKMYINQFGSEPFMIVRDTTTLGLAEAYENAESANHPLSMSEEELEQMTSGWQQSLQLQAIRILQLLPPEVLQLIIQSNMMN